MSNTNKLNIKDNNYALEVLSYYLWGQSKAPAPAEIVDEKFIRPASADTTVKIDAQEYMDQIVRPNFELGKIKIFETFFSGATKYQAEDKKEGKEQVLPRKITALDLENVVKNRKGKTDASGEGYSLTHDEFVGLFYPKTKKEIEDKTGIADNTIKDAKQAELPLYHYTSNSQSEDYWMRAFTFGSTKLQLDTKNIRYVFDKNGNPLRLENVSVQPMDDDFNFVSSTGSAKSLNPLMEKMMDPSGIGRTVKFKFIDGKTSKKSNEFYSIGSNGTYTAQDYKNYLDDRTTLAEMYGGGLIEIDNPKYIENYSAMLRGLKVLHESNVYNYLDDKNRLVIFGTDSTDNINKTVTTKQIDLDNVLSLGNVWSLGGWAETSLNTLSWTEKYQKYVKNGIVYVTGNDNDTVIGTDYDDRLLGGKGNDTLEGGAGSDYMEGGQGYDTYHIQDNDTISDSDMRGRILFPNKVPATETSEETILGYVAVPSFTKSKDANKWEAPNPENEYYSFSAEQKDNDLIIRRGSDSVTIKDFFTLAAHTENSGGSLWSGLGIKLLDKPADTTQVYRSVEKFASKIRQTERFPNPRQSGRKREDSG